MSHEQRVRLCGNKHWPKIAAWYEEVAAEATREGRKPPSIASFRANVVKPLFENDPDKIFKRIGCCIDSLPTIKAFNKFIKRSPSVTGATTSVAKRRKTGQSNEYYKYDCGHQLLCEFVASFENKYPEYRDFPACPTCVTGHKCVVSMMRSNDALEETMAHKFNGAPSLAWPDKGDSVHSIDFKVLASHVALPKELYLCPDFIRFSLQACMVRHLDLPGHAPTYKEQMSVNGGLHPDFFEYPAQRVLRNPGDNSIGLVSWNSRTKNLSGKDFLFIGNSGLSNESIKDISIAESKELGSMPKFKRSGSAGGWYLPTQEDNHDTLSMSKATAHDQRAFLRKGGNSTGSRMAYRNLENGGNRSRTMYKDCYGRNLSERQALVLESFSEREHAITTMEFRLKCLLATVKIGLTEQSIDAFADFEVALETVVGSSKESRLGWRDSVWHSVLLEWACGFFDTINHQATVAHVDGNEHHFLEDMSLFGIVPADTDAPACALVDNLLDEHKGILCFPLKGLAVEIDCGRDALALQMKTSTHLADRSRGRKNFSKVKHKKKN